MGEQEIIGKRFCTRRRSSRAQDRILRVRLLPMNPDNKIYRHAYILSGGSSQCRKTRRETVKTVSASWRTVHPAEAGC